MLYLKSIGEILNKNFYIPSYQRGYRWDRQQVLELLNDIYEFSKKKPKEEGEFYCLQPIVLLKDEEKYYYKVIDGQQRLTTIYIILKFLKKEIKDKFITYETRKEKNREFFKNISNEINYDNPDFYYMSNAYQTIEEWFKSKSKEIFLGTLLDNTKVIWYELDKNEDEIDVFTRLNIGKIPLTNSELIKAILLFDLEEKEKLELVMFWDYIEKRLQDDNFFYFLTNETKYKNTRIDFIFELIAKKYNKGYDTNDSRFSFYVFEYLIKEKPEKQKELWDKVKEYFRIFEELYNNNTYYHYIGFLINSSKKIKIDEVIKLFKKNSKDKFEQELKNKIKKDIKGGFKELDYNENREDIEYFLFLFNVLITMDGGYSRYPFDRHILEKWSLEHIHAQNSEDIKKDKDRRVLLEAQKAYIEDKKLKKEIEEVLKEKEINENEFKIIQEEIFKKFGDDINIHTIDNLALLSTKDNSALSNNIFPYKRDKIKELDKKGSFIPLGTKNVFMKYYSNDVKGAIKWNKKDRKNYLKALKSRLEKFYIEGSK